MKTLKHILVIFAVVLLGTIATAAQTQQTHTVQRGESLEFIAAKYGVSTQAIRDANPQMTAIYVGYKVIIPQQAQQTPASRATNTRPVREAVQEPAQETATTPRDYSRPEALVRNDEEDDEEEFTPHDFDYFGLTYFAPFDAIDYGYYGICGQTHNYRGFGIDLTVAFNYGIAKKGARGVLFKFGPSYGYAFNKYLMLSVPLRGIFASTDAFVNQEESSKTKTKYSGGVTIAPGIVVKLGSIFLSAEIEVGWTSLDKKLYNCVGLRIGI